MQQATPWHLARADGVIADLQASPALGLTNQQAQERLRQFGPNLLPESTSRSGWSIFIDQFKTLPVGLLAIAAALSVATGGWADAVTILGVVLINAVIGYFTENHSEQVIHSLKHLIKPSALVLREGMATEIKAQELVQGDLLILKPGSYVAADARLLEATHLSLDESSLTGESMPVTKTIEPLLEADVPLGDRTNMVYMGTLVTGGQGRAIVVATGAATEMGRIQTLVGTTTLPETPMERQLDRAGSQLVLLSSAVCAIVFGLGLLRGYDLLQMLKTSIALAVAAVPEGLPAVATTTLALGIREMGKHRVLIRRLEAVEALGSVQSLCLDKTGTLTENKMSVVELYVDGQAIQTNNEPWLATATPVYSSQSNPSRSDLPIDNLLIENLPIENLAKTDLPKSHPLPRLLQAIVLCNESEINGAEINSAEINGTGINGTGINGTGINGTGINGTGDRPNLKGSATENALIDLASRAGLDVTAVRQSYPLVSIHHRSEDWNVMSSLHRPSLQTLEAEGIFLGWPAQLLGFIATKGSPAEVLALCDRHISGEQLVPLTDSTRQAIAAANDRMAGNALRVLGVAYGYLENPSDRATAPEVSKASLQHLIWLGLVGMADPIRKGVKPLIEVFHTAGIRTVMITGDQSSTARAIGQALNLSQGEELKILDFTHWPDLGPEIPQALYTKVHIFARISPAQKLQIVQTLQQAGRVVAMTGDGINDAPALKAADVGVAMGHTGTDVAREVADVVLEDDDLATMAIAISRGRTIYNNIRKAVHFLLSTNLSEILVMFIVTAAGLGQPLNAMQLLWLNLVTDIFPGLALALEPPEADVLQQPPRDPKEAIIKPSDFRRILFESIALSVCTLLAYSYAIACYGIGPQASTIAFMGLTCGQLLHALSCRSSSQRIVDGKLPPNPFLVIALGISFALQFISALVPALRSLLHLTPISWLDCVVIGGSALLPLLVNEATKGWAIKR